jgi:hypothetical protein
MRKNWKGNAKPNGSGTNRNASGANEHARLYAGGKREAGRYLLRLFL